MKRALLYIPLLIFSQNTITAQNLISNGGFESGLSQWTNLSGDGTASFSLSTTDKYQGTQALRVVVGALGTNTYSIQSIHAGSTVVVGKKYILSFYAKAATNATSLRGVMQNTRYSDSDFSLGTTWQKYEWNYTAGEVNPRFKFHYIGTGTIWIDNISLEEESGPSPTDQLSISPTTTYQTLVGFGGAITWFCHRILQSPKSAEITNLLFTDLGADIVRFKNWYYPANYPTDKTTNNIEGGVYWKNHLTATNQLAALAKQANPNVEILLSSWTPPSSLKSNGKQENGTLKKNNGAFKYNELGTYWKDVLDNITFNPDYITIQNEPGFVNDEWGTCEWRPTETATLPGLDKAVDAVYNAIKNRPFVPKIIGPETENIGNAKWDNTLNIFREFTKPLKTKPHVYGYAYHTYNFYSNPFNFNKNLLNMIRNEFGDKPNFMTEFSGKEFSWLATADAIQDVMTEANATAYIHWSSMWSRSDATPHNLIEIDNQGNYVISNTYYTIKHFAKYIDKGYKRIGVTNENRAVKVSGYLSPNGRKLTLILLNKANISVSTTIPSPSGYTVTASKVYQSNGVQFYQDKGALPSDNKVVLPDSSLTTVVLDIRPTVTQLEDYKSESGAEIAISIATNPFQETLLITSKVEFDYVIADLQGKIVENGRGIGTESVGGTLLPGIYALTVNNEQGNKKQLIIKK